MVEKVFISPNRVRAYGNIINMKTGDDFTLVNSELTVTTDTVNGAEMTVFQFGVEGGISIALVSSASTCNVGDNVLLTATVIDGNAPVEAAEVTFKVGETVLGTDETDANGVATYTYTTSSAGSLSFSATYQDSTSNSVSVTVNHSYSLAFSQATYTASGGSATLECTLLEDNVAKSGASITVTGTDSSTYTATTNSSGVASVTVTGISASTVFTATYQGATATCTVTVVSYLFYDECNSATGLSNYGSVYPVENNTNATLTYDSTMNAYKISNTGGGTKLFPITALTGLTSLHLEAEFYLPSTTNRNTSCGLEVVGTNHTSWGTVQNKVDNLYGYHIFRDNSFVENVTAKSGANLNEWIRFKIDIDGVNVTYSFEQLDGTVIYQSTTLNLSTLVGSTYYTTAEDRQYGISIAWNSYTCYSYVRNIKATTL